jgi:hypothetical protein
MGELVPMVIPCEKKSFMTKLFGRRVA